MRFCLANRFSSAAIFASRSLGNSSTTYLGTSIFSSSARPRSESGFWLYHLTASSYLARSPFSIATGRRFRSVMNQCGPLRRSVLPSAGTATIRPARSSLSACSLGPPVRSKRHRHALISCSVALRPPPPGPPGIPPLPPVPPCPPEPLAPEEPLLGPDPLLGML